jgi:F-type H+-transporting ATPase subunit b
VLAAATTTTVATTSNFLIPNGTFVVELVLFLIVLGIVAKFILPPIEKVMNERESAVRSSLEASHAGQAEADRLVRERRETLDGARAEARGMLEKAAGESARLVEEARARGLAEHARALAEAQPGLASERARLQDEVLGKVDEIVIAAASQIIGEPLEVGRHRATIDALVAEARVEAEV